MARQPKPWRRSDAGGAWYAWVRKERVWLAPPEATKTQANAELVKVLARMPRKDVWSAGITFRDAVNLFLANAEAKLSRGEMKPLTLEGYRRFLAPAAVAMGRHPVAAMKPHHVSAWLDASRAKPWNSTTRNNAITAVKACLNWARKAGRIPENPIRDMEKPPARVTEADMTPNLAAKIMDAGLDQPFRDFMAVAFATGARPSELLRLEARHIHWAAGVAIMEGKTTGRTRRDRVIHLNDAVGVLGRLAEFYPDGPLLRNRDGNPWTRHALAHRFARMRRRLGLGKEATAKGFRHGFGTDGLEKGVPIATMAELMGHRSTKMLERHYSKLRQRSEHLKEAAGRVRPGQGGSDGKP
jgi:integrase